ncbi:YeeE/YedE family protein [Massilia sp. S19_KUP03_FR1]|uniref:YeeE/YedE family protein n=1 Tax=Massilia sp. S19_KUP03_FR1 TaxID=3025503 RepID=UPI002FCDAE17
MHIITSLITGLIFGIGLILSGMTNPAKVIGFLDLAGRWDPSLGFVMVGAILVMLFAARWARGRTQSLTGAAMRMPTATGIDRRLVLGSLTFGVGWGLAGYCPGPALASLASGGAKPWLFVAAMVAGMLVFEVLERVPSRRKQTA